MKKWLCKVWWCGKRGYYRKLQNNWDWLNVLQSILYQVTTRKPLKTVRESLNYFAIAVSETVNITWVFYMCAAAYFVHKEQALWSFLCMTLWWKETLRYCECFACVQLHIQFITSDELSRFGWLNSCVRLMCCCTLQVWLWVLSCHHGADFDVLLYSPTGTCVKQLWTKD